MLVRHYPRFVPGAVATVLAIFIALPVSAASLIAVLPWTLASAWHLAAASRSLGLVHGSVPLLALERWSHHFLLCVTLGLLFGAALFGAFLAVLVLPPFTTVWRTAFWGVFGLLALALVARFWPIYTTSFLFQGRTLSGGLFRWRVSWYGPGYVTAWRMTSPAGAFRRFTLPVLAAWLVAGGATLVAGTLTDGAAWMIVVALWAFVVSPYLHLLTVRRAECLRAVAAIPSGRVVSSAQ